MNEIKPGDVYRTVATGIEFLYKYDPIDGKDPWVCIAGDGLLKRLYSKSEFRFEDHDVRGRIEAGELSYSHNEAQS